ncbi:nucleoside deaminase [Ethanoligenens harbinense]|nr:nucleoside deaminase [Ethanoligenens harbinense YUAN-3]AYF40078.1 nucleoside deaminase [Ethanoligenens harbinense]AYF42910.1 nucleoside deaminase [Ethanoligenens harbinense]QCN93675.1 nucleoside deaminase [Ethanoligenens harbinense]
MHETWMRLALEQAERAGREGEVPIGAVIVKDGAALAVGRNRRETDHNALAHAEAEAIRAACAALGSWRLSGCTLYVTLEPCPMCAGAIINARVDTVVFGAYDPKAGASGSVIDLFSCPFNHHPAVMGGVLEEDCRRLLQDFFAGLRRPKNDGC